MDLWPIGVSKSYRLTFLTARCSKSLLSILPGSFPPLGLASNYRVPLEWLSLQLLISYWAVHPHSHFMLRSRFPEGIRDTTTFQLSLKILSISFCIMAVNEGHSKQAHPSFPTLTSSPPSITDCSIQFIPSGKML